MNATRTVFVCVLLVMTAGMWAIGQAAQAPPPGQGIYDGKCRRCHGSEGRGTTEGPKLVPFKLSYEKTLEQIRHPECDMPAFRESELSDEQVGQIVDYLKTLK
jgi:mono/diheme cytochrome c family protein